MNQANGHALTDRAGKEGACYVALRRFRGNVNRAKGHALPIVPIKMVRATYAPRFRGNVNRAHGQAVTDLADEERAYHVALRRFRGNVNRAHGHALTDRAGKDGACYEALRRFRGNVNRAHGQAVNHLADKERAYHVALQRFRGNVNRAHRGRCQGVVASLEWRRSQPDSARVEQNGADRCPVRIPQVHAAGGAGIDHRHSEAPLRHRCIAMNWTLSRMCSVSVASASRVRVDRESATWRKFSRLSSAASSEIPTIRSRRPQPAAIRLRLGDRGED